MSKNGKLIIISAIGILVIINLIGFVFLLNIRGKFTKYLEEKYPDISFRVGFTKINPVDGDFYAKVTCSDDRTTFNIYKLNYGKKSIEENYLETKNHNNFNNKINDIFEKEYTRNDIRGITGSGLNYVESNLSFNGIHFYLIDDIKDPILTIKDVLNILKNNDITSEIITVTYEKDKHVYEIHLTSDDYYLTEKEVLEKIMKIK